VLLALFTPAYTQASDLLGQCVYPVTIESLNGGLAFPHPIYIASQPYEPNSKQILSHLSSFTIGAVMNNQIQLVTVPDYNSQTPDQHAGKVFGWGNPKDFKAIELRNCN
jgi:hypothetical protein